MSFLYPWALATAALMAVPIIIHLLRRRTERRVPFPALRYLQRAERKHARSLRVRDLLLLAVRAGILALIALAAAGPLVGRGGPADHDPVDVAIVFDNSASTARPSGDRTAFELLRDRARASLAAAGAEDRFWLYPTVGPPLALAASAPEVLRALTSARPTDGAANLRDAVATAVRDLPGGRTREVHLLSDLQATNLPGGASGVLTDGVALIAFAGLSLETANGMVGPAETASGLNLPIGVQSDIIVSARWLPGSSSDPAPTDSTVLRLEIDGSTRGAAAVGWGDDAVFRLPALEPGSHGGRVEVDPSGLRADDARHFSFRVVDPPSVTFTGGADSFVGIALETLQAGGRIVEGDSGVGIYEAGPDVPADLPGGAYSTVILVPPADPLSLPRFNQLLGRAAIPWSLAPEEAPGELGFQETDAIPGLTEVRILSRYRMVAGGDAGDSVQLATTDGEPWLVRGEANGRTYIVLASPLDDASTSVPGSPTMIPFMETLILRWGLEEGWPTSDFPAGTQITLPLGSDSVVAPDGGSIRVDGGAPFVPDRAGLYRLHYQDDGVARHLLFAVNVPEIESDLTPREADRLSELFPGREVVTAGPGEAAWLGAVYRNRRGRDVALWLVVAIAALALAEIVLASPAPLKDSS
jgi:hypothetical protein